MGFYNLSKDERQKIVFKIEEEIIQAISKLGINGNNKVFVPEVILHYASDSDTYIRKNTYMAVGRIYWADEKLRNKILRILDIMLENPDHKIRQCSVYALGEIGKQNANVIFEIFEKALKDKHHSVRNAVIGALKQMGQKNPEPTFEFARLHLHDKDPEIRREIIHGIELRGRTNPEEVLPLLEELQYERVRDVRKMIIHVIGQISYKKGCLERVVDMLKDWKNRELVDDAIVEILNVHRRYGFAARSPEDAEDYIKEHLPILLG